MCQYPASTFKNSCGIISRSWPQVSLSLTYDIIVTVIIVQTFCRDKHVLVATKLVFCRDKSPDKHVTNYVCCKKYLSRQTKHNSLSRQTNKILSRQVCRKTFVATKTIVVAAPGNDIVEVLPFPWSCRSEGT